MVANDNDVSHYVVTSHPPGAVLLTAKCNFVSPTATNVIVAKSRRLEVRQLDASLVTTASTQDEQETMMELLPSSSTPQFQLPEKPFPIVLSIPVNGRLTSLTPIRHPFSKTAYLFLTTERLQYAVISYCAEATPYQCITHASGSLKGEDQALLGREAECAPLVSVDPYGRCIALHLYDGLLTFIPINLSYRGDSKMAMATAMTKGSSSSSTTSATTRLSLLGEPYHTRIEERTLLDMTFLKMTPDKSPQIALLHQDSRRFQHVVSHTLDLKKRQLLLYGSTNSGTPASATNTNNNNNNTKKDRKPSPMSSSSGLKKSRVDGGSAMLIAVPPPPASFAAAPASTTTTTTTSTSTPLHPATAAAPSTTQSSSSSSSSVGGVLVIGQRQITYLSRGQTKVVPTSPGVMVSWEELPPEQGGTPRYLLGDEFGYLHVVVLHQGSSSSSSGHYQQLQFDTLGKCVVSSSLEFLMDGLVFVASQFGDSQLLQIHPDPIPIDEQQQQQQQQQPHHQEDDKHDHHESSYYEYQQESTYLSIVEEYTHLGPILDFDLVPTHASAASGGGSAGGAGAGDSPPTTDALTTTPTSAAAAAATRHGYYYPQSQVVTASGTSASGSIRLIRNGIGMNEYASVEIPGIQNMWSVRERWSHTEDKYLVQSFVGETRVLGVSGTSTTDKKETDTVMDEDDHEEDDDEEEEGGTLEEVVLTGLDSSASTLYVGNVQVGDTVLQITESEIRLLDAATFQCVDTWIPPTSSGGGGGESSSSSRLVTVAAATESGQIAIALRGGLLLYFVIRLEHAQATITLVTQRTLEREISCIDLNPFSLGVVPPPQKEDPSAMDIDTTTTATTPQSTMVAVGLWDDFTVRLLSLEQNLEELLQINLSTDELDDDDAEDAAVLGNVPTAGSISTTTRTNRNNMMARSLCLITLDSSSASASITNTTTAAAASSTTTGGGGVNMLFVGLGDGTLVSFAVITGMDGPTHTTTTTVRSKKEVSLGTQRINLIPLRTEHGGTCVLATGDRPTVIYLAGGGSGSGVNFSNPKLCYSNVNLSTSDVEEDDINRPPAQQSIAVNVATPFASSSLFDTASLGSKHYSLCVSDDSNLRLGVIDDIQKLHVTTRRLGMAPRRVVHCPEGRLFAVGCIESGSRQSGMASQDANMGNCIRFLDDTTFDDIERIDLEPYEMILSMANVNLSVADPSMVTSSDSVNGNDSSPLHLKPYLLVGTAYAIPDEDEPTRGRILVLSCLNEGVDGGSGADVGGTSSGAVRQVTELQVRGGVYSICQFFEGKILASINSKTQICQLTHDGSGVPSLSTLGIGHHGHILSLAVKSRANRNGASLVPTQVEGPHETMSPANAIMNETPTKKKGQMEKEGGGGEQEQLAIVGDLMRSISLVQYYPQHKTLEEIARDFNANWTTAIEMLTDDVYLGAENWNNLFVVRRNAKAQSEEVRCRLDTVGEYHLGEMVNKFMGGSLVMPHSNSSSSSSRRSGGGAGSSGGIARRSGPSSSPMKGVTRDGKSKASSGATRTRRPTVTVGSQTLFATVDGTIGSILGLDMRTAVFFSTLEKAMEKTIPPVGDLSHREFRAFDAEKRVHPSHGFVDGDLVETFLDLDRPTMETVVRAMNHDGGWEMQEHHGGSSGGTSGRADDTGVAESGRDADEDDEAKMSATGDNSLTVEDVLAMVEEMTMLH